MTISERIKERRKNLNLSIDDIAHKIGKNRTTVYRYESSQIENMPVSVLEPLAKALQTTPAYLMGWDDNSKADTDITPPADEAFEIYKQLDELDKAEIRGEMKHMLKADKYKKNKHNIDAVFHTINTDDDSAALALQATTVKN